MKRIICEISGIVQGVNFRSFSKKEAQRLGISGHVRNNPDGTVYLFGEGKEEDLKKFIEILKSGPSYAEVSEIKTRWEEATGEFSGFNIVY